MSGTPGWRDDPGRQPERTALAWQRTALAFLVLALASARLAWPALGGWALLPASAVGAGAIGLLVAARRRYHRTLDQDREDVLVAPPDGRMPALAAGLGLAVGALAVLLVWLATS